jgi:POT family proton-dependent oligopeptide transporter
MPSTAASSTPRAEPEDLFGHPKGLYVCFFTEMWERFSYYGMKALLALYLIKHHHFSDADSLTIVGAYGGLVYAMPLIGGLLADRYLGMRKAVVFGGLLLCCGHLGMSVEGQEATLKDGVLHRDSFALAVFYLSLALIVTGVGFLKPNISTIVGKLYADHDPRRDSGFTLFYAGINVGALFSALICGYLGERFGWGYGFGAAGIGMLAGLGQFLVGQHHLLGHAEPPHPAALKKPVLGIINVEWLIYLATIVQLPLIWALMQLGEAVLWVQVLFIVGWLAWLGWYVNARCDRVQRDRMLACVYFVAVCLLFFSLYEQTFSSWELFTDRMLSKDLFPSLVIHEGHPWPLSIIPLTLTAPLVALALRLRTGILPKLLFGGLALASLVLIVRDSVVLPQDAEALTYLGSLFIVLLSPLYAWLWPFLARRGLNPSKPVKSAFGLAICGLSFLPLSVANATVSPGHLGSVWWLALAYLILEIAEAPLSPIGLSAMTELSVPAVVGVMMGAWWLGTSFSEQMAVIFSKVAALELPPDGQIDLMEASAKYGALFQQMVYVGLGAGLVALLFAPLVKKWMHEVA